MPVVLIMSFLFTLACCITQDLMRRFGRFGKRRDYVSIVLTMRIERQDFYAMSW